MPPIEQDRVLTYMEAIADSKAKAALQAMHSLLIQKDEVISQLTARIDSLESRLELLEG